MFQRRAQLEKEGRFLLRVPYIGIEVIWRDAGESPLVCRQAPGAPDGEVSKLAGGVPAGVLHNEVHLGKIGHRRLSRVIHVNRKALAVRNRRAGGHYTHGGSHSLCPLLGGFLERGG